MSFDNKNFILNEKCNLLLRKGKGDYPIIFLQRKKSPKNSFIYLSLSDWETLVAAKETLHNMVSRVKNDKNSKEVSVAGEDWPLSDRRVIRVSKLNNNVFIGIFECDGSRINYRRGMNLDESAWNCLNTKLSEIQSTLLDMQRKHEKPQLSKSPSVPSRQDSSRTPVEKSALKRSYDVKMYGWVKTSGDGDVVYKASHRSFYTREGADHDASLSDVDYPDALGYKMTIDTSMSTLECDLTPEQIVHRVHILYLWNYIRSYMNDTCWGCKIDHPSQKQHMDGGCLAEVTEDLVDIYLSSGITCMVFGKHLEVAMTQLKRMLSITDDVSPYIQACHNMSAGDICAELLKVNVLPIDAVINELHCTTFHHTPSKYNPRENLL